MRIAAAALILGLVSLPSFAKNKAPKSGEYCSSKEVGSTKQDKKGNSLTCKADKNGKPRWTK